jgi:uncharacterized membrane protein (GlpM family)
MTAALVVLALKALAGGVLVVLFSLLAEVIRPKSFSGLLSAAPSVAIAGLLVTTLTKTPHVAAIDASGMVAGAVAMVACCAAAVFLVHRLGAIAGTAASWVVWAGVAIGVYVAVLG